LLEDKINNMYTSIDDRINGVSRCEGYVGYLQIVTACHLLRTQFKIFVQSRDRSKFALMSVLPGTTTSYFEGNAVHLLHQVDTYGRSGHFYLLLKRDTPPNSLITEVAQNFDVSAGFSDARELTLVQLLSDVFAVPSQPSSIAEIPVERDTDCHTQTVEGCEMETDCEAGKSQGGQDNSGQNSLISCWSQKQYDHFKEAYPWMTVKADKNGQGRLGCSVCREVGNLGCKQHLHLSVEWRDCFVSISQGSTKSKQLTSARKKIFLHQKSEAHKAACHNVETRETTPMETYIPKMRESQYDVTANCLRTAYYVAHQARPFTDHDDYDHHDHMSDMTMIHLQQVNGADMGSILHSPSCCTEMVKVIAADMRQHLYKVIRDEIVIPRYR